MGSICLGTSSVPSGTGFSTERIDEIVAVSEDEALPTQEEPEEDSKENYDDLPLLGGELQKE